MVQRKRSRKSSLRKRSLRKKSRKRSRGRKTSQSGGGLLNWYAKVNPSTCRGIATRLLNKNHYKEPGKYIRDYNLELSKKSGFFTKAGHIMKSGIFGLLVADIGLNIATSLTPFLTKDGRKRMVKIGQMERGVQRDLEVGDLVFNSEHSTKYLAAGGLAFIAIIAGIVSSNIKGKRKQGKMILQIACDEWNVVYPKQKININDIKKLVSKNKDAKKIMKSVKKTEPKLLNHAFKTDKLNAKHK